MRPFRHVTILPSDLFPPDPATDQCLRGLLVVMEQLDGVLYRYRRIGVSPATPLRDIPLLTAGIRAAAEAARTGKAGRITFSESTKDHYSALLEGHFSDGPACPVVE
ncbi:hypothetical protein [Crenobacter cavernae]|uniref:Uncharacterized protein n=1 Tax=Crenobacter cavernae TaxID=2290923 RepID=A0A345Y3J7_9NEIS|nr:hypothetical protein [Crenobacter cavernae]AXK38499.1 hypothetical protein DWG20_03135 [Crenobacter cavernae]